MNLQSLRLFLLLMLLLLCCMLPRSVAALYPAPIEYRQTLSGIVEETQVRGWPADLEDNKRYFEQVVMSADGRKLAFLVKTSYLNSSWWHVYTVNADGSGLLDLTAFLPEDWSGYLQLNHDGSKLFLGRYQVYYCSTAAPVTCGKAIDRALSNGNYHKPFFINRTGSRLYFKHEGGWNEAAQRTEKGFYSSALGGAPALFMHIDDLPCLSNCGGSDMNMLTPLALAADAETLFFAWDRDYLSGKATAMWYVGASGGAAKIADEEHYSTWPSANNSAHIASADGSRALYAYIHAYGEPHKMYAARPGGGQVLLAETGDLNGYNFIALSPDGRFARFSTTNYRATLVEIDSGLQRDTGSYYINPDYQWNYTDLSADNRYYGMGGGSHYTPSRLLRVDMAPQGVPGHAPHIADIGFSASALLDAEGASVGVQVRVSDAQGAANIEWVRLSQLVEGRERPDWPMGREPLAFPSGDAGSTLLYDDGTHGDASAGDGIYSFDAIATRKGDYDGFNTWYTHYTLPHPVGVRIIAKDKDNNYAIADTLLRVTNNPADVQAGQAAAVLQEDFTVLLRPVDVFGTPFDVVLKWYPNPYAPTGMFWRLESHAPAASPLPKGATLQPDLGLLLDPVDVFGTRYTVTLHFYPHPVDREGLYWQYY